MNAKNLMNISNLIWLQPNVQIENDIKYQIKNEVWGQVRNQITLQIRGQITEQLGDQLYKRGNRHDTENIIFRW